MKTRTEIDKQDMALDEAMEMLVALIGRRVARDLGQTCMPGDRRNGRQIGTDRHGRFPEQRNPNDNQRKS